MKEIFEKYIHALQKHRIEEVTEHTYRKELQELLQEIASTEGFDLSILPEPKREKEFGAPDYKIKSTEAIVGYVENKKLSENLDKILESDQLEKYQSLSDNILLTNYIEWIWIKDRNVTERIRLCELSDLKVKSKVKLEKTTIEALYITISKFFEEVPKGIGSPKELAKALANRARYLRDFIHEELVRQETEENEGRLYGLYDTFKSNVFSELEVKEFSDAFSQTLVYGLFIAKLNAGAKTIDLYNAKRYILPAFGLIRELVDFLDVLDHKNYKDAKWIVEEVLSVMNTLDLRSIEENLSYEKTKTTDDYGSESITYKDPYIYFYEEFLAKYDRELRKQKGVYYTPPEVVNIIVRSIEEILQNKFGIDNGYADKERITVLDFATGTGTFIVQILEQLFERLPKDSGKKNLLIKDHVLKNFFGFEYLIAPYSVAHLKLSQFLKDQGYELDYGDKFQVYLTNTLEPLNKQLKISLLPSLSSEVKASQEVKDKPILVITGNPPYSKVSKNNGDWIVNLVNDYKYVDGKHFGERQNWFRDDYVKFIRFAQWKMDNIEEGVVGIITNHTYIDNVTFRGMRQSLLNSFDQIYILDLHGSAKKEEIPPDGQSNNNVFDIEQGVAITFFIKKSGLPKKVFYSEFWGNRKEKYAQCLNNSIDSIAWEEVFPESPYYFFYPRTEEFKDQYYSYLSLKDIFKQFSLPLMTGRDKVTICRSKNEVQELINYFKNHTESEIRKEIPETGKDSRDWKVLNAKKDIVNNNADSIYIKPVRYRLFDTRFTFYTGKSKGFHASPQKSIVSNMLEENIGLLAPRQLSKDTFQHVFCTDQIPEMCTISSATKEQNQLFPLYLYEFNEGLFKKEGDEIEKSENFTSEFREQIDEKLGERYSPEEIFGFIYALLHSPTYREKYIEFLKIEFARIPLISDQKIFEKLSNIGLKLTQLHLLNESPTGVEKSIGQFIGNGNYEVENITYNDPTDDKKGRISINNSQYFDNISKEIWEYKIGGYEVLSKYLKERKGMKLDLNEVEKIEQIAKVIQATIQYQENIDTLTGDWI